MSLTIEDYSEKSFVVYGENTKIHIDKLKELGGKYNSNLKIGPGWIFSNTRKEKVQEYFNNIDMSKIIPDEEIMEIVQSVFSPKIIKITPDKEIYIQNVYTE
jgi:hypothetical protein